MPDIIKDRSSTLGPGATERFVDVTGLNEMAQQVVLAGGGGGGALTDAQLRAVAVPVSLAALPVPAARTPIYDSATGAAAIAKSSAAHATAFLLHWVTVHFSAAPTTSENLTVIRNSVTAAAYDVTLCKVNPSVGALTDIVYMPDVPLLCKAGDVIDVAFTNTDTKTYGVEICTESV